MCVYFKYHDVGYWVENRWWEARVERERQEAVTEVQVRDGSGLFHLEAQLVGRSSSDQTVIV